MKKTYIAALGTAIYMFVLPLVASAQSTQTTMPPVVVTGQRTSATLESLEKSFLAIIDTSAYVLISLLILFFFIGLVRYVFHQGSVKERPLWHDVILWSLIGLYIIIMLWAVIKVAQTYLFR